VAGVVNKMSQLDFTGAGDDEQKPSRKNNDDNEDEEDDQPKMKQAKKPAFDFT